MIADPCPFACQALAQQDPASGVIVCWPHFSSQFVPTDTEPSSDRVTGAESVLQRVADAATEAHQMRRGPLTPAAFTANISANSSRASHTSSAIPSDPALPLGGVPESRSSSVNSHSVLSRAEKSRLRRQRKRMKQRQQAQQQDEHSSDADSSSKVSEYMSEDSSKAQEPSREREHTAVADMSRAASSSELHIAQPMHMHKSQSSQGRPRTPSLHDSNEHRDQAGEPDSSLSSMAVKTPPSITGAPTRPVQPTPLVNMPSTSASGLVGSLSADEIAFCPVSPSRSNDEDREQSIKKSVWVGSVPEHSTCEDLCEAFRDCGTVKTVTIRTSRVGQMAFIHFDTVEAAERALQKDGLILDGVPLMVRPKTTRSSRSPSFAGPEYQPNIGNDSIRSQASQQAGLSFSNASALGLAQSLPPKPAEQVGGWLPHGSLPTDQQKARNGRGKRPPMLKKAPSAKASPQQVQSRTRALSNRDQYPAALAPALNDTFTAYPNTATTNGATGGQTAVPFPAPWAFTYVGNQIVPILPPITPQFLPFNVVPPYLAHDQYLQGFTQAYGPYQGQSPYANTTPTPYSSAFAYSQPGPSEQTDFVNPLAFPIPQTNVEAKHTVSETEQARDRRLQQVATTIPHFRRTSSESALGSPFAPMPPKGYVIDGFAQDLVRGQPPRADQGPMMYPQLPPGFSMPSPQQWQHHGLVDPSFAFQYQEPGGADANNRAREAQARGPPNVEASPTARNRAQVPRSQINVPAVRSCPPHIVEIR